MNIENPWVASECRRHALEPNALPTYLQEQYGQLGEDLILEATLKSYFNRMGLTLEDVRYLEVGANHPIQTNNTYLFSRKWQGRGVLVEANPDLVPALRRVRPGDQVLHYAVVPAGFPQQVQMHIAANAELSSIDPDHVRSFGSAGSVERCVEVSTVTLDELLEHCFPQGLHLLSIDIEGLDLDVIRSARLLRRPAFIVTEPSRHYHADAERGFAQALSAHGYVEVARTDFNLIYGDRSKLNPAAPATPACTAVRPRMVRTFDIFDTLIARHCIRPEPLFVELERRSGLNGLAIARQQAERQVERGFYDLSDIYKVLSERLQLTLERTQEIATLEVQLELENVVPIADQLAMVQAESVLVTDMYLPESAIAALLQRAGLRFDVPIVRTSCGKRDGSVWEEFRQQGLRCSHLGDNTHSDVDSAARRGARATLSTVAQPSLVEMHLYTNGFPEFACTLRSMRLMSSRRGLPDWLYRCQTQLNLPVLVATAATLLGQLRQDDRRAALFASRDGRLLKALFDALRDASGEALPHSRYWYTSRCARTSGEPSYLEYCRHLLAERPMLIDLCGTGASLAKLFDALGLRDDQPAVFFCEYIEDEKQQTLLHSAYGLDGGPPMQVSSLLSTRSFVDNEVLELLNAVAEGMVRGVVPVAGHYLPLRDEWEFEGEIALLVRAQERFVGEAAGHLRTLATPALLEELTSRLPELLSALHDAATMVADDLKVLMATMLPAHRSNEALVLGDLLERASPPLGT